jgi:tRNA-specific 2-thiouridylase
VVTTSGEVVGEHAGYAGFTVGQRRGLPGGAAAPRYVVAIRPAERTVVVGDWSDLDGHAVTLEEVNWLAEPLGEGGECQVQVRYRSRSVPATVTSAGRDSVALALLEPARAITPGQSGVLYSEAGQVLGGGVIAA